MFGAAFLGKMFGTQKATEGLINGLTNGIDKLFYTQEEKSEDAAKARSESFSVLTAWLKSTSGSRLARRVIALTMVGIWAMEHISSVILGVFSVFSDSPDKFIKASEMLAGYAATNNTLVAIILAFYFGGPVAMDGISGLLNKWVGTSKDVKDK